MVWILIISWGWIPPFLFALWLEERARTRKRQQDKVKRSRLKLKDSIQAAGNRIKSERDVYKVLSQSVRVRRPLRKACGLFSSYEAQMILK